MDPTVNGIARRVAEMIPANNARIGLDAFRGLARHLPHLAESIEQHDADSAAASSAPEMPPLPTAAAPVDSVPRLSGKAMGGMARQMVAMQRAANNAAAAPDPRQARYQEALDTLPDRELAAKKQLPPPESPAEQDQKAATKRKLALRLSKIGRHPRFRADLDEYGILEELHIRKLRAKTLEQLIELRNEVREVLTHVEAPSFWHYALDYGSQLIEALSIPAFKTFQTTPLNGLHDAIMADEDLARMKDLVSLESDEFGTLDPRFGMASRALQIIKRQYDQNTALLQKQLEQVPAGDLEAEFAELDNVPPPISTGAVLEISSGQDQVLI